jgi:hypothetical protein
MTYSNQKMVGQKLQQNEVKIKAKDWKCEELFVTPQQD